MSDERISVAELLARGGGGATPPAGGRRRRHRGGENSITVAELTGEIPVVRDDAPAPTATGEAAESAGSELPDAPEQAASTLPDAPSAPIAPSAQGADEDEDTPVTSSFLAAAVEDVRADEPVEAELVDAEPVDAEPVPTQANRVPESTVEVEELEADDPRLQTSYHTGEARDEANYAWSRWDRDQPPVMATADFNTAQVRERQARFAEADAEDTVDVAPVTDAAHLGDPAGDSAVGAGAAAGAAGLSTRAAGPAAEAAGSAADTADDSAGIADDEPDSDDAKAGGRGQGWLALIAEVVLGLAAGAGMFYGFFKLWNWGGGAWTIALTVVLAFVVIIAIVTFTHYLRKSTDYLTLGLALLVGLVITFGPLLMALATGPGGN